MELRVDINLNLKSWGIVYWQDLNLPSNCDAHRRSFVMVLRYLPPIENSIVVLLSGSVRYFQGQQGRHPEPALCLSQCPIRLFCATLISTTQ